MVGGIQAGVQEEDLSQNSQGCRGLGGGEVQWWRVVEEVGEAEWLQLTGWLECWLRVQEWKHRIEEYQQ